MFALDKHKGIPHLGIPHGTAEEAARMSIIYGLGLRDKLEKGELGT